MKDRYTIAVAGAGYVGLSNSILLAQHNKVFLVDVVEEKIEKLCRKESPIDDKEVIEFLADRELDLLPTMDGDDAYAQAEYLIVATPTNYDDEIDYFDTTLVEAVIEQALCVNPNIVIIIKSTIPVGYTELIQERYPRARLIFSPEFLREGKALYDNLYPSRIVIGLPKNSSYKDIRKDGELFAELLVDGAIKKDIEVLYMRSTEAESVKLFSNTYLAMRVAFFNELDTYAEEKGLDASAIIKAMMYDPRIGNKYNNPSFGYGGYCLPKDTKQMVANFQDIPNDIIKAIVNSNHTRKSYITNQILKKIGYPERKDAIVGIYRLTMKAGSDNFRAAAIQNVIQNLNRYGINIVIYEPTIKELHYENHRVIADFDEFKRIADIIVANRTESKLDDVMDKVYTRDIFGEDS